MQGLLGVKTRLHARPRKIICRVAGSLRPPRPVTALVGNQKTSVADPI